MGVSSREGSVGMQIPMSDEVQEWNLLHCNKCGWTGDKTEMEFRRCCKDRELVTVAVTLDGVFMPWHEKRHIEK